MSRKRIGMNKIRETIRQHEECGLSGRQIARALGISRPVVSQYVTDFKATGLEYREIAGINDEELLRLLGKRKAKSDRYRVLSEKFEYYAKELKRVGVTLGTLYREYKDGAEDVYSYTQFCYHFQVWKNMSNVTMHIEHKAGDKLFVDYTGKKMRIYNRRNEREYREVEILVAILGASQLTYVEATESQKKEEWIKANDNALRYIGGVPKAIVPDCLKSAITNGNKYEPDINPEYADFARHYGTVIVPARPKKPQDKALAEQMVKTVYTRIFAPLRNRKFYFLEELNEAIWERLDIHNEEPFQRMKTSRQKLFNEIEKEVLKPLPCEKYEWKNFLSLKVQFNYHISFSPDKHYYSVPWHYKGKRVSVVYTVSWIEIYHKNIRIASHKRDRTANGYSTKKEHRHPKHRFYTEWSPQRFINWGQKKGESVKTMVEKVLESREYPEQAYKVCLGILSLSKKYGDQRLNRACERALEFNYYSYKAVKNILEKGLDKIREEEMVQELPLHGNIRGNQYFN